MTLYRSVLHPMTTSCHSWFLEVVASYTSILNDCTYSLTHHFMNVRNLLKDQPRSDRIFVALKAHRPEDELRRQRLALLRYAAKLTTDVGNMVKSDFEVLKIGRAVKTERSWRSTRSAPISTIQPIAERSWRNDRE